MPQQASAKVSGHIDPFRAQATIWSKVVLDGKIFQLANILLVA